MSETAVNSGGLSKLREGRQRRAGQVPPPRHPAAAPATPQDPVSAETTAPAAASPVMSRAAAGAERAAVRDIATPPDRADTEVAAGRVRRRPSDADRCRI